MNHIFPVLLFTGLGIVLMFIARLFLNVLTPFDDDNEIREKCNLAIAFRQSGFYIALALALAGAFFQTNQTLLGRLGSFFVDGVIALVVLILAWLVNDKLILSGINNNRELSRGNTAVGLTEAGSFLATGSILYASFTGEGGGIASALVFAFLGQVALVVIYRIYDLLTPVDLTWEINDRNVAAAIAAAGNLVAFGIILAASIAGPFTGWVQDLGSFALYAVLGLVLLIIAGKVSDWLFLPSTTIDDEIGRNRNKAALILSQGITIAVAILVAVII